MCSDSFYHSYSRLFLMYLDFYLTLQIQYSCVENALQSHWNWCWYLQYYYLWYWYLQHWTFAWIDWAIKICWILMISQHSELLENEWLLLQCCKHDLKNLLVYQVCFTLLCHIFKKEIFCELVWILKFIFNFTNMLLKTMQLLIVIFLFFLSQAEQNLSDIVNSIYEISHAKKKKINHLFSNLFHKTVFDVKFL